MRLAPGEQVLIPGDLWDQAAKNRRKFVGLENALHRGDIAIVRSPESYVFDDTADRTKTLRINNSILTGVDPCWGVFQSDQT